MRSRLLSTLLAISVSLTHTLVLAENAEEGCFASAADGQKLEKAGKLVEARAQFALCARAKCPAEVASTCSSFLRRVDEAAPSFIVEIIDSAGKEVTSGTVTIDGQVVAEAFAGRAVTANPGPHTFRVDAGGVVAEQSFVLREHEKGRKLSFRQQNTPSKAPAGGPEGVVPARPDLSGNAVATATGSGENAKGIRVPPSALIVGGIGLAAIIPAAIFAVSGIGERKDLGCDIACSSAEASRVRTKFLLADVFLGVATVGIATGVVLFILGQGRDEAKPARGFHGGVFRF
jgi:hypothetical protein